jgi:Conjugative transposon protein TcpC
VKQEVGNKVRSSGPSARALLGKLGRVAIWAVLGLLLLRGLGAMLAGPEPNASVADTTSERSDQASTAFAVHFARTYLADPSASVLAPFLAEGVQVGTGRPPTAAASPVAQAEVNSTEELGGGRAILTVACELRDARTLYVAVPIVRTGAGEVAALGAPSIVAAPGVAGADSERPQPLAGSDAGPIQALVAKFLPQYVSSAEASDLSYLLAPGTTVQPLGGALQFLGVSGMTQLGSGEGPRRVVLAAIRVTDPGSGAIYPLSYRLELIKGARWYVEAIQGASA